LATGTVIGTETPRICEPERDHAKVGRESWVSIGATFALSFRRQGSAMVVRASPLWQLCVLENSVSVAPAGHEHIGPGFSSRFARDFLSRCEGTWT
jgi:hypothetical protein